VRKTANYGLLYNSHSNAQAQGFTDADWAACHDTRHSTGGYLFKMVGMSITWQSKRQPTVSRSSTELEYIALSTGTHEAVWLTRLLADLNSPTILPFHHIGRQVHSNLQATTSIPMHYDNQSTLKLAKNHVFHARTKHIEVHHHFVCERLLGGEIKLHYIPTDLQPADILTKALARTKFE
jgi:hypothetical protein